MAEASKSQIQNVADAAKLNPFAKAIKEELVTQTGGNLSSLQKKIVSFIEDEAKLKKSTKLQPPPISPAEETSEEEKEFHRLYGLTYADNDLLIQLIFHGDFVQTYSINGCTFTFRHISPKTRYDLSAIAQRVQTRKAANFIKIRAITETLVELDGISLNKAFLGPMIPQMQDRFVDVLYTFHLTTEQRKLQLYEKLPNFCKTPQSMVRFALLNNHNTLVTDPLFQALTDEQIYWHYINIMKQKELDSKDLDNRMDYMSWFINAEMAKKVKQQNEMHKEADVNVTQKFSFMNGVLDLIKGDMTEEQAEVAMKDLMAKMKNAQTEDDPWDVYSQEDDSQLSSITKNPFKQKEEVGQVGMAGGDPSWHKEPSR